MPQFVRNTLDRAEAAVGHNDRAGNVGRQVGGQKHSRSRNVFGLGNPLLKDALASQEGQAIKALAVIDESLHTAQPAISPQIETYFKTIADCVELVCPPLVLVCGPTGQLIGG